MGRAGYFVRLNRGLRIRCVQTGMVLNNVFMKDVAALLRDHGQRAGVRGSKGG